MLIVDAHNESVIDYIKILQRKKFEFDNPFGLTLRDKSSSILFEKIILLYMPEGKNIINERNILAIRKKLDLMN